MNKPALWAEGVTAYYGTSQILFGLDLFVSEGQVMAILGRNGAGKTTTIRTLMGLLRAREGRIGIGNTNIETLQTYKIARLGVGYVPEDRQIFPEHSVEENLELGTKAGPKGNTYWTIPRVYEIFPMLRELRSRIAGRLSGGEQQMLAIGRTLMGNPSILLLDEPSEGLAPLVVNQIAEALLLLRRTGLTVLIAEQNMRFCMRVATHVSIIEKGTNVYQEAIDTFAANEQVQTRYLSA